MDEIYVFVYFKMSSMQAIYYILCITVLNLGLFTRDYWTKCSFYKNHCFSENFSKRFCPDTQKKSKKYKSVTAPKDNVLRPKKYAANRCSERPYLRGTLFFKKWFYKTRPVGSRFNPKKSPFSTFLQKSWWFLIIGEQTALIYGF